MQLCNYWSIAQKQREKLAVSRSWQRNSNLVCLTITIVRAAATATLAPCPLSACSAFLIIVSALALALSLARCTCKTRTLQSVSFASAEAEAKPKPKLLVALHCCLLLCFVRSCLLLQLTLLSRQTTGTLFVQLHSHAWACNRVCVRWQNYVQAFSLCVFACVALRCVQTHSHNWTYLPAFLNSQRHWLTDWLTDAHPHSLTHVHKHTHSHSENVRNFQASHSLFTQVLLSQLRLCCHKEEATMAKPLHATFRTNSLWHNDSWVARSLLDFSISEIDQISEFSNFDIGGVQL